MQVYISSLNEVLEVDDRYLPQEEVGLLDESDLLFLSDEEEGEENWEGD